MKKKLKSRGVRRGLIHALQRTTITQDNTGERWEKKDNLPRKLSSFKNVKVGKKPKKKEKSGCNVVR